MSAIILSLSEETQEKIEEEKKKLLLEQEEAKKQALEVGFTEKEAEEMAYDWVDVRACFKVLFSTDFLPDI